MCNRLSAVSQDVAKTLLIRGSSRGESRNALNLGGGGHYIKTTGVLGVRITPQFKGKSMGLSLGNLLNYKCKMVRFEPILKLKK